MLAFIQLIAILAFVLGPYIYTTIEDKCQARYLEQRIKDEMMKGNRPYARLLSDELGRIRERTPKW